MLNISKIAQISLVTILITAAVTAPLKVKAQDESMEQESIVPPSSSGNQTPPPILDESDSSGVSDVEEYDG